MSFLQVVTEEEVCCKMYFNVHIWYEREFVYDNPEVNSAQEFIEIFQDFSNSLDLVREAISNAFDAQAKNIVIDLALF